MMYHAETDLQILLTFSSETSIVRTAYHTKLLQTETVSLLQVFKRH